MNIKFIIAILIILIIIAILIFFDVINIDSLFSFSGGFGPGENPGSPITLP